MNSTRFLSILFFIHSVTFGLSQAHASQIERVSLSSSMEQGNGRSSSPSISADGRYVAFHSESSNLVAGDTNGLFDVFVHDRTTGETERVSITSSGLQAIGNSSSQSISADGRFVAFGSSASNLATSVTINRFAIYVRDRTLGETVRVSVSSSGAPANADSFLPSISADGRVVAFYSKSDNLVEGDTNNYHDIFVHDLNTGMTERLSVSSTGEQSNQLSLSPSISADGQYVAFTSTANNLVDNDTNDLTDVFVHNRATGTTERVSLSSAGEQVNAGVYSPAISADGRYLSFHSSASNLVDNDTNGQTDIFIHDRTTGITERVNMSSSGNQANGSSVGSRISASGRYLTFQSSADNLVAGDTNGQIDIFMHDRITGTTERVNTSSSGDQANDSSHSPTISANGRVVVFYSPANNLVLNNSNNVTDVFASEINLTENLMVTLHPTSGATQVGEYIRFRARLTNQSTTTATNCRVLLINPLINFQREFSYYSYPLNVSNPIINGSIDIAPGATGQFNLAVLPRVAMRREITFDYFCDNGNSLTLAFLNTAHLVAKTEPLITEDFVQLENSNNRTALEVDRNNGKYWTGYAVNVSNTGNDATSINLTTTSSLPGTVLRQSQLCEPIDPVNNNWSCINPRDTQIQVELGAGENKKILVYVHARQSIEKKPIVNRINLEAHDGAGEIVAKTSMGVSTLN